MIRPDPALVATFKAALGDRSRAVAATIDALPPFTPEAALALSRAAKGSRGRADALAGVWLDLGDARAPGWADAADAGVRAILADRAAPERSSVVQRLAFVPAHARFVPELCELAADRADPDWGFAVMSLGELRDARAVAPLMAHSAGVATPFVVVAALVKLRDPVAALVFEAVLAHPEPRDRTFALWGLAALGYPTPKGALVDLLDDPDVSGPQGFMPGQSTRAAQALADVHGWPFEWGSTAVPPVRARCAELYPPAWRERCREALARGHLDLREG